MKQFVQTTLLIYLPEMEVEKLTETQPGVEKDAPNIQTKAKRY